MNLAFQVETEGAERIPVEIFARDLRINQTLHASLVSKGRGAVHGEVANGEDPVPNIVLGLPFFQRYQVAFQQVSWNENAEQHDQRFVMLHA